MKAGKEKIRLDKFLTSALEVSRSQAREKIKKGLVHVEDRLIKDPAYKVMPEENVYLDGQRLSCQAACYLMLNKPAGVISATEDTEHKTVLDLVTMPKKGLFPV
ncbi:MAG: 16S rRNA pseudouridine(516) synthase, partial [Eubacterium sp.]|nr:16S rRNA pseudouridine(516) synthase [Eubacterium sp.]